MYILIGGFLLVIVGIGSTYIYDYYKAIQAKAEASRLEREQARISLIAKQAEERLKSYDKAKEEKKKTDLAIAQIRAAIAQQKPSKPSSTPGRKPGPIQQKKVLRPIIEPPRVYDANHIPTEARYEEVDSVPSIKAQETIKDLIARIEAMKKK